VFIHRKGLTVQRNESNALCKPRTPLLVEKIKPTVTVTVTVTVTIIKLLPPAAPLCRGGKEKTTITIMTLLKNRDYFTN
jgi:hypothetical protein